METNENGFIIDPKYKPAVVEEIHNHRIGLENMTYADALHLAWVQVNKSELDPEIKEQITAHLARIFLRVEI